MPFDHDESQRQLKLSAVVAGVAIIAFIQQLYALFTATGGKLLASGQETISFLSVAVLFITVFYLLLKQMKTMQAQLRLAFVDELTGLPNRRSFLQTLDRVWEQTARGEERWAVLYLDLDKFKSINDSYGHDAGDEVIRAFGERLTGAIRKTDTAARLSGDEFAIILRDIEDEATVCRIADDILLAMQQPIPVRNRKITLGTSIGACLANSSIESARLLISFADFALMQAKNDGRNVFKLFNPDMAQELEMRGEIATDLREAVQSTELQVIYQPLYSKGAKNPWGVEALVRWEHPKHGTVSPAVFIPIAEEIGVIEDLTWLVLCKGILEIKPLSDLCLSVNVSSNHFLQPGFVLGLVQILNDTGIDPTRLEIEISEAVFHSNLERAVAAVKELRSLGVEVAVDDFGTSHSNMTHLRDVPISRIKIDKSFTSEVNSSETSRELVTSMIKLGRSLGLNVTVEGVESAQQLEFLNQSDCTDLQGFLLSKPVSGNELRESIQLLQNQRTHENGKTMRGAA